METSRLTLTALIFSALVCQASIEMDPELERKDSYKSSDSVYSDVSTQASVNDVTESIIWHFDVTFPVPFHADILAGGDALDSGWWASQCSSLIEISVQN